MKALLATRRYPALLTFVSIAILVVGVLAKPKKASTETLVSETETIRLQQMSQKKSLEDMTAYFSRVAGETARQLVFVPRAEATGLVWNNNGAIVTAPKPQSPGDSVKVILPAEGEGTARWGPADGPVGTLQLVQPPETRLAAAIPASITSLSSWVLLMARRNNGALFFTPGLQRGVRQVTCGESSYREIDTSIELTPAMTGGGLFNLDGYLLGIILPCDGHMFVLPAGDIDELISRPPSSTAAFEKQWGLKLVPLDEAAQQYFRTTEGLLVREVRDETPASRSGLQPGDVLLSLDGEAVPAVEDFVKLAAAIPESGAKATVLRGGRKRTLTLSGARPPSDSPAGKPDDIGIVIAPPPAGYLVENVAGDSAAHKAGVMPGDRLLEVNGSRVVRFDDVGNLLNKSPDEPRYLLVSRGERRIGILLP